MGLVEKFEQWRQAREYNRFCRRVSRMSPEKQREISTGIYSELWESLKAASSPGQGFFGGTSVFFDCPYHGHVSYHAGRMLQAELSDDNSPIQGYDIGGSAQDGWTLTVIAQGDDPQLAEMTADAAAMSTILKIPTSSGIYDRLLFSMELPEGSTFEEEAHKLFELAPKILRDQVVAANG